MSLGVTVLIPVDLSVINERLARKIAELCFTGVGAHLAGDPDNVLAETCRRTSAILEQQGIRVVQFWGMYDPIISTDEMVRRAGVHRAQEIIRLASQLGAAMVGIRPTSLNPEFTWWPYPDNYLPATETRLIRSLREIASACEAHGVPIALECHVTTKLDSPKTVRSVLEAVDSPWVKVNLDPVIFVDSITTTYQTAALLTELFEELAPYIASAHIKDVYVENRHVVHISEIIPGDGLLDFDAFFTGFEALLPDGYGFIEHLPESQIPQAAAFVRMKLRQLGISIH